MIIYCEGTFFSVNVCCRCALQSGLPKPLAVKSGSVLMLQQRILTTRIITFSVGNPDIFSVGNPGWGVCKFDIHKHELFHEHDRLLFAKGPK